MVLFLILCACSPNTKADGWYPVSDNPEGAIDSAPLATVHDFDEVTLVRDSCIIDGDTVCNMLIQGRVKPEKRQQWADGTELLIGKRLGFVYNDSVITAPQVNARIESGSFQISTPDTALLKKIYESIAIEKKTMTE